MEFDIVTPQTPKDHVIKQVSEYINRLGFKVVEENFTKPWGAYWRLDDSEINRFIQTFYNNDSSLLNENLKQSPKILITAPHESLSWQYHNRRNEIWKILRGPAMIMLSYNDNEQTPEEHQDEEIIIVEAGRRHRLSGEDSWVLWTEIWQHTDPSNPSNEEDNVRISDLYGREGTNTRN